MVEAELTQAAVYSPPATRSSTTQRLIDPQKSDPSVRQSGKPSSPCRHDAKLGEPCPEITRISGKHSLHGTQRTIFYSVTGRFTSGNTHSRFPTSHSLWPEFLSLRIVEFFPQNRCSTTHFDCRVMRPRPPKTVRLRPALFSRARRKRRSRTSFKALQSGHRTVTLPHSVLCQM